MHWKLYPTMKPLTKNETDIEIDDGAGKEGDMIVTVTVMMKVLRDADEVADMTTAVKMITTLNMKRKEGDEEGGEAERVEKGTVVIEMTQIIILMMIMNAGEEGAEIDIVEMTETTVMKKEIETGGGEGAEIDVTVSQTHTMMMMTLGQEREDQARREAEEERMMMIVLLVKDLQAGIESETEIESKMILMIPLQNKLLKETQISREEGGVLVMIILITLKIKIRIQGESPMIDDLKAVKMFSKHHKIRPGIVLHIHHRKVRI